MASYQYVIRYAEYSAPSTYYYIASTHATNTGPSDTPASTAIPGGLRPINFSVSLFDGIDPKPSPRGGFGSIVIDDTTGALDYLIGKVMSGGTLTVLRGTVGAAISTFTNVATLSTAGMQYDAEKKEIRLRDMAARLEAPLHDNRYLGTGGKEGDATLAGIIKPYGIGPCFNVTPRLILATTLIYQLTDSAMFAVSAVRNGGTAWTFGTDRANYAAMAASAPASGAFYDTCLAEGLIRLGQQPDRDITVDFTGDTQPSVPYLKRANIAQRIVTRAGTTISVNAASVTALNTLQPADTNFFWDKEISKAAALTEVMQGCLGFWWVNLSGELVLGQIDTPTGTAQATFNFKRRPGSAQSDFVSDPEALETAADPRWKTTLGYKRNYTIQEASTLAAGVGPGNVMLYGQEAQWSTIETANQRTYWPTAPEVKMLSGFTTLDLTFLAEVLRQQTIFQGIPTGSRLLERIKIRVYVDPFTALGYMGGVVAIAGYDRYSWSNPRKLLVVGVEFSGDAYTTLTLWG